jgi:hypothetical protein
MKFSVIAATTLIASTSAATGDKANKAECSVWNDCVADNSCVVITKTGADGALKNACILTTACKTATTFTVSTDSKEYISTADSCLKEKASTDKAAAGSKCEKSEDCATDLRCGGAGESSTYLCIGKATCGEKVDDKEIMCESSIRNAISMAVAAVAVAYAL